MRSCILGELRKGIQALGEEFQVRVKRTSHVSCRVRAGRSQRAKHGTFSNKIGLVALLATEQVKRVRHSRVEERVLGVEYRVVGENRTRAVCGLHGLSSEGESGFAEQLGAAEAWLLERGGGLLVGDFNQVPCRAFRNSVYELTAGDMLLRNLLRFNCSCYGAPVLGGKSRLIGEGPKAQAFGGWTHFDGDSGTSCIDFGVEVLGGQRKKGQTVESGCGAPAAQGRGS